jgi:septum formation protein
MILSQLLKGYRLILASQSPRRKTLLEGLDISFEVIVREGVNEEFPLSLGILEIPEYIARAKSEYYNDLLTNKTIIITADTIVWHNNHVVGKPVDTNDARKILSELSGSMHEVVTGVCIKSAADCKVFNSYSRVFFRRLSDEEINYYVEKYNPLDKAGAYGIQEWIGYAGIEKIEGSFYNVMGLPVQMLYQELMHFVRKLQIEKD